MGRHSLQRESHPSSLVCSDIMHPPPSPGPANSTHHLVAFEVPFPVVETRLEVDRVLPQSVRQVCQLRVVRPLGRHVLGQATHDGRHCSASEQWV